MKPIRHAKSRLAYTLLELMIALGLLGALLSVAWSLMGTYRDAEERGWKTTQRIQIMRAARRWLENDALQLTEYRPIEEFPARQSPVGTSSGPTIATLIGNSQGFTATVIPSLDPLPFLERLMSDALAIAEQESNASLGSDSERLTEDANNSPWPTPWLEIEYRLMPQTNNATARGGDMIGNATSDVDLLELPYALVRRELLDPSQLPEEGAASGINTAVSSEPVLTLQDLYRQDETQSESNGFPVRESRLDGLVRPQFRYCDGQSWKSEWSSQSEGGLPAAIALCFDFPARSAMKRPEPIRQSTPSSGEAFDAAESSMAFTMDDAVLASEPLAEQNSDGQIRLMDGELQEVQIIVLVPASRQRDRAATTEPTESLSGSRGGF